MITPANAAHIHVRTGVQVNIAAKTVTPSRGDVTMRCGRCGGTQFGVFVTPATNGAAQVRDIVCQTTKCLTVYPLNDTGQLGGNLEIRKRKGMA